MRQQQGHRRGRWVSVPLTCPLPRSDWKKNPETGRWYSVPWTTAAWNAAEACRTKLVWIEEA